MLRSNSLEQFLDVLASDAPAPGGGSVAALSGALSAALLGMVCQLSVKRPELEARHSVLSEVAEQLTALRAELLQLVDEDTEAFSAVMRAFKLPKGTDDEKAARSAAIQSGYVEAVNVPLRTARCCASVAACGPRIAEGFNANAASDLGAGMECALAGLRGAVMNVRINLPSIKDAAFVSAVETEVAGLEATLMTQRDTVRKAL